MIVNLIIISKLLYSGYLDKIVSKSVSLIVSKSILLGNILLIRS